MCPGCGACPCVDSFFANKVDIRPTQVCESLQNPPYCLRRQICKLCATLAKFRQNTDLRSRGNQPNSTAHRLHHLLTELLKVLNCQLHVACGGLAGSWRRIVPDKTPPTRRDWS